MPFVALECSSIF